MTTLGLRHSEWFGNVLVQSAALWWRPQTKAEPEWLARQFVTDLSPSNWLLRKDRAMPLQPKPGTSLERGIINRCTEVEQDPVLWSHYIQMVVSHDKLYHFGTSIH